MRQFVRWRMSWRIAYIFCRSCNALDMSLPLSWRTFFFAGNVLASSTRGTQALARLASIETVLDRWAAQEPIEKHVRTVGSFWTVGVDPHATAIEWAAAGERANVLSAEERTLFVRETYEFWNFHAVNLEAELSCLSREGARGSKSRGDEPRGASSHSNSSESRSASS
jgi:hypothetical protein